MKEGRRTHHPELVLFASWGDLQDYAAYDPAGCDLQPFVDLVDTHGPDAILAAVSELTEEAHADITVSTAHKAKGREWPTVRIGNDFPQPKDNAPGWRPAGWCSRSTDRNSQVTPGTSTGWGTPGG